MEPLSVKVVYKNLDLDQNYRLQKNEDFQNALAAHADTKRTPQWSKPHGIDGVKRCARYDLRREAPSFLQRVFDSATPHIAYYETTTYADKQNGKWKIQPAKPEFAANWIKASGKLTFKQKGADVVRQVEGNVEVHLPFLLSPLNGALERYVVELTKKGLIRAAELTPVWVLQHGIPAP